MVAMVQVKMIESTWLNRLLYKIFMPVGYKVAGLRFEERKPVGLVWRFLHTLGEFAVFRPLRDKLGLVNATTAYSSGAAQSPDVIRFFRAIGVNIKQLYGSTEAQTHTAHIGDDVKFETVGVPAPGMEIKIAEDGEILVSGPTVVRGYYKNPEATEKAFVVDQEGKRWYRTGDAGYIDSDGHLIYLDRVKEMLTLSSGEKYSPQYIEGQLKFSPYVHNVMSIGGEDSPFVTALINIDFDNVGRWAERQGLAYTTFVDLSQKPEVYELIRKDVERVNRTLPPAARVRKFVLLHKEFDADEGELTRTRKLRRGHLGERYGDMIATMYGEGDRVQVQAAVKYRDGREGVIETTVRIATLEDETDVGLVLIFKSSYIFNFAQGQLLLMGALVTWWLSVERGLSLWLAILLALFLSALLGLVIERLALRPMTGQPLLSIILMTLALSQVLQGLALLLFGGAQRNFPQIFSAANPYRITTPFVFNDQPIVVILKQNLTWSFVVALLGVLVIGAFFRFTKTGLAMRGTSEDHELAQSLGLNINRIFGLSWALAGVVATVGGILLATSSGLDLSLSVVVLAAFPAVLLGGLESIPGTIVGGLIIGLSQGLVAVSKAPIVRNAAEIMPYVVLLIVLIFRPEGLFGQKRIERI